jgi:hypothetical protein
MKWIVPFFKIFLFAVLYLCIAGTAGAQGPAVSSDQGTSSSGTASVPVTGSGTLGTATFLSAAGELANGDSSTLVAAFTTTLNLTGSEQCIELKYSGEVAVVSRYLPLSAKFRATIDDVIINGGSTNGQFFNATDSGFYTTAAMNWWECNVSPGAHTVKILFKPVYSGDTAYVRNRTLIIEYSQ